MPSLMRTAALLGVAALAIACTERSNGPNGGVRPAPSVVQTIATSAKAGVVTPTPDPHTPCPLSTSSERQQWVDRFLASHPSLDQLPYLPDEAFVRLQSPPEAVPTVVSFPDAVSSASDIVHVHTVTQTLDTTWSPYQRAYVPSGQYFGVAGRSQLAVDELLKGDAASVAPFLTMPFFIAANSQCQPVVALGFFGFRAVPTPPVFEGEQAVLFLVQVNGMKRLVAVIPILNGYPSTYAPPLWRSGMTEQEFLASIRRLVAGPSPTIAP